MARSAIRAVGLDTRMELTVSGRSGIDGGVVIRSLDTRLGTARSIRVKWADVIGLADQLVDIAETHEAGRARQR